MVIVHTLHAVFLSQVKRLVYDFLSVYLCSWDSLLARWARFSLWTLEKKCEGCQNWTPEWPSSKCCHINNRVDFTQPCVNQWHQLLEHWNIFISVGCTLLSGFKVLLIWITYWNRNNTSNSNMFIWCISFINNVKKMGSRAYLEYYWKPKFDINSSSI